MISIQAATSLQKEIVLNMLKALLSMFNCTNNYQIVQDREDILIRQRTGTPPSKEKHKELSDYFADYPFIRMEIVDLKLKGRSGQLLHIPSFLIKEIDDTFIDTLVAKPKKTKKPDDVEELIWFRLPEGITLRWKRLSKELQNHIIACANADLSSLYAKILGAKKTEMGKTFISPISSSTPSIPVRLQLPKPPIAAQSGAAAAVGANSGAEVDKVYDLLEILEIEKRDPADENKRCHPLTGQYFSLDVVIPAADALKELKKRAEKILDTPAAGAVGAIAARSLANSPPAAGPSAPAASPSVPAASPSWFARLFGANAPGAQTGAKADPADKKELNQPKR